MFDEMSEVFEDENFPALADIVPLPPLVELAAEVCDYLVGEDPDYLTGVHLLCSLLMHGVVPVMDGCSLYDSGSLIRESCVHVLQNEERLLLDIQPLESLDTTCEFLFKAVEALENVSTEEMGSESCIRLLKKVLSRAVDVFESLQVEEVNHTLSLVVQDI
jgi:hypothetical protein